MTIILILLAAFLSGTAVYFILRPKIKLVKETNEELLKQKLELVSEISQAEKTLSETKELAAQQAKTYYEEQLADAKTRLRQSVLLEQQKYERTLDQIHADFYKEQEEANLKAEALQKGLAALKSKYDAAMEESHRREEMAAKLDYYRIVLPEEEKREIAALMSIEPILSNKRNLYMLIWTNYYSKRANDLATRVFGNKSVMGIYRITNIKTQQMYIGQAKDCKEREREHLKAGLHIDTPGNNKLYSNMFEYGIENFTFELLEECHSASELNEREKYWIEFYDTYNNGLNGTRGNKS